MLKRKLRSTGINVLKVLPLGFLLVACAPNFSPNTYSSSAVQKASKVDSGVVIGVRKVAISVDSTLAATTGAAAGGIGGSQVADGAVSALSALGGAVVGGITGSEVGHKARDTYGYEYIVRKANGDLLSVTQKDKVPLKVGQRVLLIQGMQARIVNDYTEPVETEAASTYISQSSDTKKLDEHPTTVVDAPTAQVPVTGSPAVSAKGDAVSSSNASTPAETPLAVEARDSESAPATSAPVASNVTVIPVDIEPQTTTQPTPDAPAEPASALQPGSAPEPDSAPGKDTPNKATTNAGDPQNDEPTSSTTTNSGATSHGPESAH